MIADEAAVVGDVILVLAKTEKVIERFVVREVLNGRQLQSREAHVVGVEIHRDDSLGSMH